MCPVSRGTLTPLRATLTSSGTGGGLGNAKIQLPVLGGGNSSASVASVKNLMSPWRGYPPATASAFSEATSLAAVVVDGATTRVENPSLRAAVIAATASAWAAAASLDSGAPI